MHMPRRFSARRSGFTLIELLTVIGIISLLIAIALPSFSRARDLAKKTTSLGTIDAITKDLEIFQNAFGYYPDSNSTRVDPILNLPHATAGDVRLTGAHWLARALAGPDQQGIDSAGRFMKDKSQVAVSGGQIVDASGSGTGVDFVGDNAAFRATDRKGTYFADSKLLLRDNDSDRFSHTTTGPNTGRLVIVDSFGWPILYYKANPRAQMPLGNSAAGDSGSVYDQADNAAITGGTVASGYAASSDGYWDFGASSFKHGIGFFGPPQNTYATNPDSVETTAAPGSTPPYKGKSFVDYLHDHKVHDTGATVKSVLPETFLLISPGKDGIYGTDDDANNFNH